MNVLFFCLEFVQLYRQSSMHYYYYFHQIMLKSYILTIYAVIILLEILFP